jgi:NAD(P)H-hydrate epimerase
MRPLSRDEVRSIDQIAIEKFAMTGLVLMENAGRNAAYRIDQIAPNGRHVILCGLGNNGGDGFVIARHLEIIQSRRPQVWIVAPPDASNLDAQMSNDARANFEILGRCNYEFQWISEPNLSAFQQAVRSVDTIVDAIVGTGASGALRAPVPSFIECANQAQVLRIAIDIPSGLDCDSGIAQSTCFRADHTVTFVAPKIGFELRDGPRYVGQVSVMDIGAPACLRLEK